MHKEKIVDKALNHVRLKNKIKSTYIIQFIVLNIEYVKK